MLNLKPVDVPRSLWPVLLKLVELCQLDESDWNDEDRRYLRAVRGLLQDIQNEGEKVEEERQDPGDGKKPGVPSSER